MSIIKLKTSVYFVLTFQLHIFAKRHTSSIKVDLVSAPGTPWTEQKLGQLLLCCGKIKRRETPLFKCFQLCGNAHVPKQRKGVGTGAVEGYYHTRTNNKHKLSLFFKCVYNSSDLFHGVKKASVFLRCPALPYALLNTAGSQAHIARSDDGHFSIAICISNFRAFSFLVHQDLKEPRLFSLSAWHKLFHYCRDRKYDIRFTGYFPVYVSDTLPFADSTSPGEDGRFDIKLIPRQDTPFTSDIE